MFGRLISTIALGATLAAFASSALAYPSTVKGACRTNYKRFCDVHAIDDPALRRCMDRAGSSLSRSCVIALVNSGHVTKARATQRWRHSF
jgi:hypothetical protein